MYYVRRYPLYEDFAGIFNVMTEEKFKNLLAFCVCTCFVGEFPQSFDFQSLDAASLVWSVWK